VDPLTKHESVFGLLESGNFDVLAFDSTSRSFSDSEIRHILQLKYRGKAVYDLSTLYKNITGKVPLSYIDGRWLLNSDGLQGQANLPYVQAKRLFDVMLSSLLLLFFAPLIVAIAIAVKLDSNGGIFFVQERLGLQRRPFKCVKFRTMVKNAERESGPMWSGDNDPRITRVGHVLRKMRLDELPQLWNILKGDMSFVGPRPIREHFANKLAEKIPFYGFRFAVKPGLSGWAQVNHDYAGSEEGQLEKFQYELFYIQNMSLFLDLLTVFKTVQKVFAGEGK
jgi:exopolysaccharide biosynthesis polyprenyl glycosylphosphotransferase